MPARPVVAMFVAIFLFACGGAPAKKPATKPTVTKAAVDPDARPAVAPPSDVKFPVAQRFVVTFKGDPSENKPGLQVLAVPRQGLPTVFVRWVFPGGRTIEFGGGKGPRWPEGTIDFTNQMLTEGTRKHRGTAFAAALQAHGAQLSFSVLPDASIASGRVLSHQLQPYLGLVKEALTQPEFGGKAVSSLRKRWQAHLDTLSTRPRSIAGRVLNRVVYGAHHPYGSPGPTAASIRKIKSSHLKAAHRASFTIPGSTLIVVGDIDPGALIETVRNVFGKALDGRADKLPAVPPPHGDTTGCHVVDVPTAVQTVIMQGNPGPLRGDAGWAAVKVANQVLGGSASSRLFTVLRERKGLTYGVYSSLDGRLHAGDWSVVASTRTAKTDEAVAAIGQELALIRAQNASETELAAAKRKLGGGYVMSLSRGGAIAARIASQLLFKLPDDYWAKYVGQINAVTGEQVRGAANRFFGTKPVATVMVGNIGKIRPAIDRHCPRLILRDAQSKVLKVLVGGDSEMSDEARTKAFASWASDDAGLIPLGMYVRNAAHKLDNRADALAALLETGREQHIIQIGRTAKDWPSLSVPVLDRMMGAFKLAATPHDIKRALRAHAVVLDLLEPADHKPTVLVESDQLAARTAIAAWAFAGVTPETPSSDVKTLMKERLIPSDLVRLGAPSIAGLEALVSTSVLRVEAARALRALDSAESMRALLRGYRRSLVERRQLPDVQDLEVIGSLRGFQTALLLFDSHALQQSNASPESRATSAATIDMLRKVIDDMANTKSNEPRDRKSGRTVLQRDFDQFIRSFEALLQFPNADDRWWAARMLIENKGLVGLRLVLHGLRDDGNYSDPEHYTVDPKYAIGDLCRNQIAPLGRKNVQSLLLAELVGRHRVAKVIAITALKTFGDVGSLRALRTHYDTTKVSNILALPGHVTSKRLAESAVDVHAYLDEIEAERKAGRVTDEIAALHREFAFYTYDLTGIKLRSEVARRVRERLAATGHRAPTAKDKAGKGKAGKDKAGKDEAGTDKAGKGKPGAKNAKAAPKRAKKPAN